MSPYLNPSFTSLCIAEAVREIHVLLLLFILTLTQTSN
jgi:hypothetical protein